MTAVFVSGRKDEEKDIWKHDESTKQAMANTFLWGRNQLWM